MHKILSLLLFFSALFIFSLSAQPPGGGKWQQGGGDGSGGTGTVSGLVVDASSGTPIEYANAVLLKARDSSLVTGNVTSTDGTFEIQNVPFGMYKLVVNFIGFNKTTIGMIKVFPNASSVNVGKIELHPSAVQLQSAEVTAEKNPVEFKIDKKVLNVSNDLRAAGGSAVDVLSSAPSVNVDIQGNVSLRGSDNFTVLVDGKPTALEGTEALQQIPASTIDRIEIITNPSAKYDPQGTAGILNIILKQQTTKGLSGIVNTTVGFNHKYKSDGLLNFKTKKLGVFVGAEYNDWIMKNRTVSTNETYHNDTSSFVGTEQKQKMIRGGVELKAGMDYSINKNNSFTLSAQDNISGGFQRNSVSEIHTWQTPEATDAFSINNNHWDLSRYNAKILTTYYHQFDKPEHTLNASVVYLNRHGDITETQQNFISDANWDMLTNNPNIININTVSNGDEWRMNLDYDRPIGKMGKLEAGYQYNRTTQFDSNTYNPTDTTTLKYNSNSLNSMQSIHAAYGLYSGQIKKLQYMAGLRAEYTDRELNDAYNKSYIFKHNDLYPSLHLSHDLGKKYQLMASYSRRVNRPRGWFLSPFTSYINTYNLRRGNPYLEPEYVDSYELSAKRTTKFGFVIAEIYYRETNNKITEIQQNLYDNVLLSTFANLNHDYSMGTSISTNADIKKWYKINGSIDFFRYSVMGNIAGQEINSQSQNWNMKLNNILILSKTLRMQITGFYNSPTATVQGHSDGFYAINAGLKNSFFKNKLAVTANIQDVFNTAKHKSSTTGIGFYTSSIMYPESPMFTLTLSYKFNNYKAKDKDPSAGLNDSGDDYSR